MLLSSRPSEGMDYDMFVHVHDCVYIGRKYYIGNGELGGKEEERFDWRIVLLVLAARF